MYQPRRTRPLCNWYNEVKSTPFDIDPTANEHFEDWPGGRYNHYYHDLNRDWAWLSQVESQQRLPEYLSWMPQIHVDFHEQGVDSPYYFAPAVEPYHEVLTDFQREFQVTIGKNHARYFDEEGGYILQMMSSIYSTQAMGIPILCSMEGLV